MVNPIDFGLQLLASQGREVKVLPQGATPLLAPGFQPALQIPMRRSRHILLDGKRS